MASSARFRQVSLVCVLIAGFLPLVARADVALTVNNPNTGAISYTLEQLGEFPTIVVETTTPWTDGQQHFVGFALRGLLGDVAPSAVVSLRAVNDYVVTMPVSDLADDFPVVAYMRNGKPMSVRDKGPLWLIYPFDDAADYHTETIYSRSIWQLIEVSVHE